MSRPPGRPRSEESKQAVLDAAYALLKKRGIGKVSTQELAAAAGVSTATLYRWWKSKEAIMLDAFFEHVKPDLSFEEARSPLERLRLNVVRGASWLQSEDGRVAVRLISDVHEKPKLRRLFLEHFYLPRRAIHLKLVQDAIATGELRNDTDADVLVDALFGPLYFRFLIGHAALDKTFATKLVNQVLKAVTA